MNMVFAYGGAMIFPELMTEMRRPHDFIRGMALAQVRQRSDILSRCHC